MLPNYDIKRVAWETAHPIDKIDPDVWRQDDAGETIKYSDYNQTLSRYGWRIIHPNSRWGPRAMNMRS